MLLIYIKIFSQRTKLKQSTMDSNENILFLNLSIKCRFYEGKYSRNIALIINSQEKKSRLRHENFRKKVLAKEGLNMMLAKVDKGGMLAKADPGPAHRARGPGLIFFWGGVKNFK